MAPASAFNLFSHQPIDRQSIRRRDSAWIEASSGSEAAFVLPVSEGTIAVTGEPGAFRLAFSRGNSLPPGEPVFLGVREGIPYFAQVTGNHPLDGAHFEDLRAIGGLLPPEEASLAAYAVGLARWHQRHRYCGVCGAPAEIREAGHKRVCTTPVCQAEHFPRTDPAVIVMIEHGDSCFLARNARYRPGLHSTLAGFVEPGESLEAAVAREVHEEAGLVVEDIRYHSSQPWPFPASLMIGFRARAMSREFMLDGEEIVEGGWFTRGDLLPHLETEEPDPVFSLPGLRSISRRLIEEWVKGGP